MLDLLLRPPRARSALPVLTLVAAATGPLVFLVAWSASGALQPASYSAVRQSISALAAASATQPWIMTTGLYVVGICQLLTAAGLTEMRRGARVFLAIGGVGGLGVAFFPQPVDGPTAASAHIVFATLCIVSLAIWPWFVRARGFSDRQPVGGRAVAVTTAVFFALLGWVFVAGHGAGSLGVAERVDITVSNLWPLVIVLALRRTTAARS